MKTNRLFLAAVVVLIATVAFAAEFSVGDKVAAYPVQIGMRLTGELSDLSKATLDPTKLVEGRVVAVGPGGSVMVRFNRPIPGGNRTEVGLDCPRDTCFMVPADKTGGLLRERADKSGYDAPPGYGPGVQTARKDPDPTPTPAPKATPTPAASAGNGGGDLTLLKNTITPTRNPIWTGNPGWVPPRGKFLTGQRTCPTGTIPVILGTADRITGGRLAQRRLDERRARAVAPPNWDGVWAYAGSHTSILGADAAAAWCETTEVAMQQQVPTTSGQPPAIGKEKNLTFTVAEDLAPGEPSYFSSEEQGDGTVVWTLHQAEDSEGVTAALSNFGMSLLVGPYVDYGDGEARSTLTGGGLARLSLRFKKAGVYGEGTVGGDVLRPGPNTAPIVRAHAFGGGLAWHFDPKWALYGGYLSKAESYQGDGTALYTSNGVLVGFNFRPRAWMVLDAAGRWSVVKDSDSDAGINDDTGDFRLRDELGVRIFFGVDILEVINAIP